MNNCNTGISIPTLSEDNCGGKTTSTKCVIHEEQISLLEIPANSTQEIINNAIMVALSSLQTRVTSLEEALEDAENRILILETE